MIYEEQTYIQSKLKNTLFPKSKEQSFNIIPLYLCVFLFLRSLFSYLRCSPSPVSSWSSFLYIRIQLILVLASPSLSQASLHTTYSSTVKENPNGSRNCQVRGYKKCKWQKHKTSEYVRKLIFLKLHIIDSYNDARHSKLFLIT